MLKMTQTDSGRITGVLAYAEVKSDGRVNSEQVPITDGAIDRGQLTLTLRGGIFGTNISGTAKGSAIELQTVGSKGEVNSVIFSRSSPEQFKMYADELKSKAAAVVLTANVTERSRQIRGLVQDAERWIAVAELHAGRIPGLKDHYRRIEDQMRSLLERERATRNSVARSQISIQINQGDIAGSQADIQVDQVWDQTLGGAGQNLNDALNSIPADCSGKQLSQRGVAPHAVAAWQGACQSVLAERAKFGPVFQRTSERRADLKLFQNAAQSRRHTILNEAMRIQ